MRVANLNSPPDETRWHLKEVPRWGGGVHDKNVAYSVGNHASMATDTVRCGAYAEAIGRVARGRRCLDVGTGPFLLLARLCERAGASFVAAVEDSPAAVRLAIELLKREQLVAHPESRWAVDEDLDEECRQHLSTIRRTCGALLPLRTLQLQPPSHPPAPPSPLLPTVLASTRVGRRLGLGDTGGVVTSLVACLAPGVVVGFKPFKTAGFESGGVKV